MPPPSTSAASLPVLGGRRVLIVEDDNHVALLLEAALGARGASVRVARDSVEFELALTSGALDIALVDLSPIAADVNGALVRLRKHSPAVVLVVISGSAAVLPDEAALEGVRWVRKPSRSARSCPRCSRRAARPRARQGPSFVGIPLRRPLTQSVIKVPAPPSSWAPPSWPPDVRV